MRHLNRSLMACLLIFAMLAASTAPATAKKKKKRLRPPTCAETIRVIEGTAQLKAQELAAQGYTADEVRGHNFGYTDTCRLIPPNKRQGTAVVTDYRPVNSDPNYEGQPFYEFTWRVIVNRTRKGAFTSTIEHSSCRYGVQTGTGIAGGRTC
jgi:hypothetical protein